MEIPSGGISRFTTELIRALPQVWPDAEFICLSDQREPKPRGLNKRWWLVGLRRELQRRRATLFHGTNFAVPYWPSCPSVLTLHDLSPWREPSPDNARVRQRCGWLLRTRIPTVVHTPSDAIRQEAIHYFGWPPSRIHAVPLAAADHLRPTAERAWIRPYVLYVGALEERKCLGVLVEAVRELWARGHDFDLLLAGKARTGYLLDQGERVKILGFVPEDQLAAFYSGALCTVYPSRYEGFGLPVLEALQCGSPVVCTDLPVLRETGGEAAIYAQTGQWAACIEAALSAPERRAAGLAQAQRFSWKSTALRMKELYQSALG